MCVCMCAAHIALRVACGSPEREEERKKSAERRTVRRTRKSGVGWSRPASAPSMGSICLHRVIHKAYRLVSLSPPSFFLSPLPPVGIPRPNQPTNP